MCCATSKISGGVRLAALSNGTPQHVDFGVDQRHCGILHPRSQINKGI